MSDKEKDMGYRPPPPPVFYRPINEGGGGGIRSANSSTPGIGAGGSGVLAANSYSGPFLQKITDRPFYQDKNGMWPALDGVAYTCGACGRLMYRIWETVCSKCDRTHCREHTIVVDGKYVCLKCLESRTREEIEEPKNFERDISLQEE